MKGETVIASIAGSSWCLKCVRSISRLLRLCLRVQLAAKKWLATFLYRMDDMNLVVLSVPDVGMLISLRLHQLVYYLSLVGVVDG